VEGRREENREWKEEGRKEKGRGEKKEIER
jgi:hypothetical protein